jgi:multidrug efflux pump subunit AcrA (membrane-fusion protein)
MSSKAIKPKIRIGQSAGQLNRQRILSVLGLLVLGGAAYGGYKYFNREVVEVRVDKVRRAEFIVSVRTRGELKSIRSTTLNVPQVPDMQITRIAEPGRLVKAGEVVVEFDKAQQEQNLLERSTSIRQVDSERQQSLASHKITNEMDAMNQMTSQYNIERAGLEVSKAEIVSQIEGEKSKIDLGIAKGELIQVETTVNAHKVAQKADLVRIDQRKDKANRDLDRTQEYLSQMVLRAPTDGIVIILPNFRAEGFGGSPPPFKAGDRVWTGASLVEIPDLSEMRVDLELEEEDRGKIQIGQEVRLRIDAVPDREFAATLDWISPIASPRFRGFPPQKTFPARATLKSLDPRLRPGMSASADIIIESRPNSLLIPQRASFMRGGKPQAYVQSGSQFVLRPIRAGKRNETDLVILEGLKEGETIALEDPQEAVKRAKKL